MLFQEEYRNKVAILEQQLACTEDELCEARLLSSKLNTELVSERSSAEVRLAEMQSRLNEVCLFHNKIKKICQCIKFTRLITLIVN